MAKQVLAGEIASRGLVSGMKAVVSNGDFLHRHSAASDKPPNLLIEVEDLLDLFGLFLLVLIGVELLDTIRAYLKEHVVQEEVTLGAALIAVARKVIVLDIKQYNGLQLVGIALVIVAVTSAYWVTKRAHAQKAEAKSPLIEEN